MHANRTGSADALCAKAVFYDGVNAVSRAVGIKIQRGEPVGAGPGEKSSPPPAMTQFVEIFDPTFARKIKSWDVAHLCEAPSRPSELRLALRGKTLGARLVIADPNMARTVRRQLPVLMMHRRLRRRRRFRNIAFASLALGAFVATFVFGIPAWSERIVGLIPPEVDTQLEENSVGQIDNAIAIGRVQLCDPDPNSVANRAMARFVGLAMQGSALPYPAKVQVLKSVRPNAFAFPGGRIFYTSALLNQTRSPDEFAGVMAHEIGHIVYRHGMQKTVFSVGSGLLVGLVLGDMTSLSGAAVLGTRIINSSFSRDAERQADQYVSRVAARVGFDSAALVGLLDRIARKYAGNRAVALLDTHPLNAERRAALESSRNSVKDRVVKPGFSKQEWRAISSMCT